LTSPARILGSTCRSPVFAAFIVFAGDWSVEDSELFQRHHSAQRDSPYNTNTCAIHIEAAGRLRGVRTQELRRTLLGKIANRCALMAPTRATDGVVSLDRLKAGVLSCTRIAAGPAARLALECFIAASAGLDVREAAASLTVPGAPCPWLCAVASALRGQVISIAHRFPNQASATCVLDHFSTPFAASAFGGVLRSGTLRERTIFRLRANYISKGWDGGFILINSSPDSSSSYTP